ncbi:MAG: hypothetical protein ACFB11_20775 [Paracoccaceae bacterium]
MKYVAVTDEEANLLPYVRHLIDGIAFYQGDMASIEQSKLILESEYIRWCELGSDGYRPSLLSGQLLTAIAKKSEAVYTAGLVGLALMALKSNGTKASLEKAYPLVASYALRQSKLPFTHWEHKEGRFLSKFRNVPTSEAAVRRSAGQYRSTLHICAARVAASQYSELLPPFEPAPEADRRYLTTVAAFQSFFSEFDQVDRDVRAKKLGLVYIAWLPSDVLAAEPYFPTHDLMTKLLGE